MCSIILQVALRTPDRPLLPSKYSNILGKTPNEDEIVWHSRPEIPK